MPLKGQHGVVAHHAASVVGNLDEFLSARLHADLDPGRARVERVLKHLFDHRGRPFHHLAGGDLVGNVFGKNVDAAHGLEQFSVLSSQLSGISGQWSVSQMHWKKQSRGGRVRRDPVVGIDRFH